MAKRNRKNSRVASPRALCAGTTRRTTRISLSHQRKVMYPPLYSLASRNQASLAEMRMHVDQPLKVRGTDHCVFRPAVRDNPGRDTLEHRGAQRYPAPLLTQRYPLMVQLKDATASCSPRHAPKHSAVTEGQDGWLPIGGIK